MARKLRVYQVHLGFYDTVVAAPSQTAALRAWGTHQNLFADGVAHLATDQGAIEAALAHPDVPLKRAVGSHDPFSLNPGLPQLPAIPGVQTPKPARPQKRARVAAAPKPVHVDRSLLDAAEAALKAIDAAGQRQETELRQRQAALDAEAETARRLWSEERTAAETTLRRERAAYDAARARAAR